MVGLKHKMNSFQTHRDKIDFTARNKNFYESIPLLKLNLIKLQGEVAQKNLKIESLNHKVSYLKQKQVNSRRVHDNLNEFHKDLFNSFQSKKRTGI